MTIATQIADLERTIKGLRKAQTEIVWAMAEYSPTSVGYCRLSASANQVNRVIEDLQSRLSDLERQQREENERRDASDAFLSRPLTTTKGAVIQAAME